MEYYLNYKAFFFPLTLRDIIDSKETIFPSYLRGIIHNAYLAYSEILMIAQEMFLSFEMLHY